MHYQHLVVNADIFAEALILRNFADAKIREIKKSLCHFTDVGKSCSTRAMQICLFKKHSLIVFDFQ